MDFLEDFLNALDIENAFDSNNTKKSDNHNNKTDNYNNIRSYSNENIGIEQDIEKYFKSGNLTKVVDLATKNNILNEVAQRYFPNQYRDIDFFVRYCKAKGSRLEDIYDKNTGMFVTYEDFTKADERVTFFNIYDNLQEDFLRYLQNNGLLSENHLQVLLKNMKLDKSLGNLAVNKSQIKVINEKILRMPTNVKSIIANINAIQKELDSNIYGYNSVKEDIISLLIGAEELQKYNAQSESLIGKRAFLFYGAPGLGKSMFAKTVAKALGLDCHVINLAQADGLFLKGSYRTWNQSDNGKIAGALLNNKDYKTCIFLLDEIDKASNYQHGHQRVLDIVSALLDPEIPFKDDFLEIDLDLSHSIFFITANDISNLPDYLLDRVHLIYLKNYKAEEKEFIIILITNKINESLKIFPFKISINVEDLLKCIKPKLNDIKFREFKNFLKMTIYKFLYHKMCTGRFKDKNEIREDFIRGEYKKHFKKVGIETEKPPIGFRN